MLEKPLIIFDTDMDTDCDDMGALALLIDYAKKDKCNLLGIVVDAPCTGGAVASELLCRYAGIDVPIGTVYESEFSYESSERYRRYRDHRKTLDDAIYYNRYFAEKTGKSDKDYPSAVSVYRRLLSNAEDNSVTVVAVGFFTAIEQLFRSGPDEYSELSGSELFRKKVKSVVSMGCADFPETDNYNFNYNMDRTGARAFFEMCECPVTVSPCGEDVIVGSSFTSCLKEDDPLRQAYEIYNGKNCGRSSWDLLCVLYAAEPDCPFFDHESHGQVVYDDSNNHVFWKNGTRRDQQITLNISSSVIADLFEKSLVNRQI